MKRFLVRTLRRQPQHITIISLISLFVVGMTITGIHQTMQSAQERAVSATAQHDQESSSDKQLLATDKLAVNNSSVAATSSGQAPSTTSMTTNTTSPVKYSTSSDPRSTAYSLTPPAPNPASFEITLTHNGQVAAGTAISYNATKNERAIYGGDLLADTPYVTLSRSSNPGSDFRYVMFTIPDGQTAGLPSKWWADHQLIWVGTDLSDYKNSGTSFRMRIDADRSLPNGSYTIRIYTSRSAQTADSYEYDYFLPVNIID